MSLQSRYYLQGRSVVPLGYEQINPASATGLTPPTGATLALLQAEDQAVRWRDDGVDPTASVGMRLAASEEFWYDGDLDAIRFIEEASVAELNVGYYKYEV